MPIPNLVIKAREAFLLEGPAPNSRKVNLNLDLNNLHLARFDVEIVNTHGYSYEDSREDSYGDP